MLVADLVLLSAGTALIGVIFGVVLYRGDYCMVAMVRDLFLIRDFTLIRSFVLYCVVAGVIFFLGSLTGLLPLYPPPTLASPSFMTIAGGFLFGIGMVLAGGCVVGTLYKMAGGNLTNWIAFAGILAGSLAYAEIHPWIKDLAGHSIFTDSIIVARQHPIMRPAIPVTFIIIGAVLVIRWAYHGDFAVISYAKGYIRPWKVAIILALLNFVYYFIAGVPLGITTAYAKLAVYIEQVFLPAHVAGLSFFQDGSLRFLINDVMVSGSAGPRFDYISATELALAGGIFSGALATALYYGEFKICGFPPRRQGLAALGGGVLLALGARIASGCNVKFFLGGLPLLSWQAIFFAAAVVGGVYCGTRILTHFVIR